MNRFARSLLACSLAVLLMAALSPIASAKPRPFPKLPSIDKSFGNGGRVPLPGLVDIPTDNSGVQCAPGASNGVYAVVDRNGTSRGRTAGLRIFARTARGDRVKGFGRSGMIVKRNYSSRLLKVVGAGDGSMYIVGYRRKELNVIRVTARGKFDSRFGGDGEVRIDSGADLELIGADTVSGGTVAFWTSTETSQKITVLRRDGTLNREFASDGRLVFAKDQLRGWEEGQPIDLSADGSILISGAIPAPTTSQSSTSVAVRGFDRTGSPMPAFTWQSDINSLPSLVLSQLPPQDEKTNKSMFGASAGWLTSGGAAVAVSGFSGQFYAWVTRLGAQEAYGSGGVALAQRGDVGLSEQHYALSDEARIVRPDGRVISHKLYADVVSVRSLSANGRLSSPNNLADNYWGTSIAGSGNQVEYVCGYWNRKEQIVKLRFRSHPFVLPGI